MRALVGLTPVVHIKFRAPDADGFALLSGTKPVSVSAATAVRERPANAVAAVEVIFVDFVSA